MNSGPADSIGASLHRSARGHRHQRILLWASALALAAGLALPPVSIEQQFWIVLLPIVVFGLSHGGADPLILRHLMSARSGSAGLVTGLYVMAALAFVALIWFFPVAALVAFLILSVWHFGVTDRAFLSPGCGALLLWLSGSLPVLGPALGHPEQTSQVFAWLIGSERGPVLAVISVAAPLLAGLWLVGFGLLIQRHRQHLAGRIPAELLLVGLALVSLPPLLGFAFYFCAIHSVRHFLVVAEHRLGQAEARSTLRFLVKNAAPATLGAIGLALAAWLAILVLQPAASLLVEAIRVMFWALAALTLPHAFVVRLWWNEESLS